MKFYQWYSQALGGVVGIASCIYCYLRGDMLIYSNLNGNFDIISFNAILASYILYPLCFLTFIMAILIGIPNMSQKKIISIPITKINNFILYSTIIVGILGCGIYFIPPALLLLIKDFIYLCKYIKSRNDNKGNKIEESEINKRETKESSVQLLTTKTEMAINLLNQDASISFITEVTGLSQDYINKLKREDPNKK